MSLNIQVEFCKNCHLHAWCSQHNEMKYLDIYEQLFDKIKQQLPYCQVSPRYLPKNLKSLSKNQNKQRYLDEETNEIVYFPKLGAFQIFADSIRIFSKIRSRKWPRADLIVNTLEKMIESKLSGGDLLKYDIDYQEDKKYTTNEELYNIQKIFRVRKSKQESKIESSRPRSLYRTLDLKYQFNPENVSVFEETQSLALPKPRKLSSLKEKSKATQYINAYLETLSPKKKSISPNIRKKRRFLIHQKDRDEIIFQDENGETTIYKKQNDIRFLKTGNGRRKLIESSENEKKSDDSGLFQKETENKESNLHNQSDELFRNFQQKILFQEEQVKKEQTAYRIDEEKSEDNYNDSFQEQKKEMNEIQGENQQQQILNKSNSERQNLKKEEQNLEQTQKKQEKSQENHEHSDKQIQNPQQENKKQENSHNDEESEKGKKINQDEKISFQNQEDKKQSNEVDKNFNQPLDFQTEEILNERFDHIWEAKLIQNEYHLFHRKEIIQEKEESQVRKEQEQNSNQKKDLNHQEIENKNEVEKSVKQEEKKKKEEQQKLDYFEINHQNQKYNQHKKEDQEKQKQDKVRLQNTQQERQSKFKDSDDHIEKKDTLNDDKDKQFSNQKKEDNEKMLKQEINSEKNEVEKKKEEEEDAKKSNKSEQNEEEQITIKKQGAQQDITLKKLNQHENEDLSKIENNQQIKSNKEQINWIAQFYKDNFILHLQQQPPRIPEVQNNEQQQNQKPKQKPTNQLNWQGVYEQNKYKLLLVE